MSALQAIPVTSKADQPKILVTNVLHTPPLSMLALSAPNQTPMQVWFNTKPQFASNSVQSDI